MRGKAINPLECCLALHDLIDVKVVQIAVFKTTVSSRSTKLMFCGQSSHQCSLLRIALNLSDPPNMGSFLIIVVNLYSYKNSDVGNI